MNPHYQLILQFDQARVSFAKHMAAKLLPFGFDTAIIQIWAEILGCNTTPMIIYSDY